MTKKFKLGHYLIVAFGASDDLLELRGAMRDEVSGGDEITVLFVDGVMFDDQECDSECRYFLAAKKTAEERSKKLTALWDQEDGYSWTFETEIPHATFAIWEDGEKFCRGVVFELKEIH